MPDNLSRYAKLMLTINKRCNSQMFLVSLFIFLLWCTSIRRFLAELKDLIKNEANSVILIWPEAQLSNFNYY